MERSVQIRGFLREYRTVALLRSAYDGGVTSRGLNGWITKRRFSECPEEDPLLPLAHVASAWADCSRPQPWGLLVCMHRHPRMPIRS